jgi:hypothetical protein
MAIGLHEEQRKDNAYCHTVIVVPILGRHGPLTEREKMECILPDSDSDSNTRETWTANRR